MATALIQPAFSSGEMSPALYGRVDLSKYHTGASTLRNAFVNYRGGANSRAGFCFVGKCKQNGNAAPPRLIPFQFNVFQGFAIEFGDNYARFVTEGSYVVEPEVDITGITQANPAVVSVSGSPFGNGDWIVGGNFVGMTELNGQTFIVANAVPGSFQLIDIWGNLVNSTAFDAYISGGTFQRVYTITTPYAAIDLPYLKYTQSADVMSLTCVNQSTGTEYPPYDLTRIDTADWTLVLTSFEEKIGPPTITSITASTTSPTPLTDFAYVVTALDKNGNESIASGIADVMSVDIATTAGSISLGWSAVPDAATYNIYKAPPAYSATVPIGSIFGYAGTATGQSFVDSNIAQDMTQTPPIHANPFARSAITGFTIVHGGSGYVQSSTSVLIISSAGFGFVGVPVVEGGIIVAILVENGGELYAATDTVVISGVGGGAEATLIIGPATGTYPSAVSYFQQRRVYAATQNQPDTYFMSVPGDFVNFDSSIPVKDDDAITGTPWALQVNGIQFMVPMPNGLVILTGLGAWQVSGSGSTALLSQAITPSNQQATPQAYNGCSPICPPIVVDYDILYVQSKGSVVRDLSYNFFANIYTGADMTMLSSHLFFGRQVLQWAWAEEPFKIVWAVRDDGTLLSFTFVKTQEVAGWARHDTG